MQGVHSFFSFCLIPGDLEALRRKQGWGKLFLLSAWVSSVSWFLEFYWFSSFVYSGTMAFLGWNLFSLFLIFFTNKIGGLAEKSCYSLLWQRKSFLVDVVLEKKNGLDVFCLRRRPLSLLLLLSWRWCSLMVVRFARFYDRMVAWRRRRQQWWWYSFKVSVFWVILSS